MEAFSKSAGIETSVVSQQQLERGSNTEHMSFDNC